MAAPQPEADDARDAFIPPPSDPAVRRERIEEIARTIAAGAYRIPAEAVADAIIRFFSRPDDA